jgi:NAD(P)H-nitrite reductase large subunit
MRALTRELKVGTCCGKCLPEAKAALLASLAHRSAMQPVEVRLTQRIESATNTLFGGAPKEFAL